MRHAWHMFPLWPDYQNRVEYKIAEWVWKNMPDARIDAFRVGTLLVRRLARPARKWAAVPIRES